MQNIPSAKNAMPIHFAPAINRPFLNLTQKHMPVPKFIRQDPELDVQMQRMFDRDR